MKKALVNKGIILGLVALMATPIYPMGNASTWSNWTTWATSGLLNQAKEYPLLTAGIALGIGGAILYKMKLNKDTEAQKMATQNLINEWRNIKTVCHAAHEQIDKFNTLVDTHKKTTFYNKTRQTINAKIENAGENVLKKELRKKEIVDKGKYLAITLKDCRKSEMEKEGIINSISQWQLDLDLDLVKKTTEELKTINLDLQALINNGIYETQQPVKQELLDEFNELKPAINSLKETKEQMEQKGPYFATCIIQGFLTYRFKQIEALIEDVSKTNDYEYTIVQLQDHKKAIEKFLSDINVQHATEADQAQAWIGTQITVGHCDKKDNSKNLSEDHTTIKKDVTSDHHLFAVYDGHGGDAVSKFAKNNLHVKIAEKLNAGKDINDALTSSFADLDKEIKEKNIQGGSTAAVALISKATKELQVAGAGDSRVIVIRNGKAAFATKDHKPNNPQEKERIINAGGHVVNGRVNGNLAVARSLGDFALGHPGMPDKKYTAKVVSSAPAIDTFQLETNDIVLLFSDGLLQLGKGQRQEKKISPDKMEDAENDDIAQFVTEQVKAGCTPQRIAQNLIGKYNYSDDTSVVVIQVR